MIENLMQLFKMLKEFSKAPDGRKVIVLCLVIAFGTPIFLGFYYADVIRDNRALKLELKDERLNKQLFINDYIRKIEKCEAEKIKISDFHINRYNVYRDKIDSINSEKLNRLEKDYNEAWKTIMLTRKVIEKTSKDLKKQKN